ncbi:hypothetical protein HC928_04535 [bacterium]|nr:hypothetical protein [bacterium]
MQIKINITGIPDLSKIGDGTKKPTEFFQDLMKLRRTSFYEQIASGKDATGKRVAPLKQAYAARKLAKWGKRAIRVASGKMQSTYRAYIDGDSLVEEINSPIAVHHQTGTDKMPARQLLPKSFEELPSAEKKMITRLSSEFIDKLINELATRNL